MRYLIIAGLVLSLAACQSDSPEGSSIDFASLPEIEKRNVKSAPASFKLHSGVDIQTFAHEPMLINPTNIDIDARGRVWVCEAQNYRGFRNDHPQRPEGDRILILEDTDHDGIADHQKVFYQGTDVNAALGIAKLGDKVYVAASPSMLVFTDTDGDDVPEKKDTLFTGLSGVDHDHGVHAVVFGPEGKLYFNFGNAGERLRLKSGELAKTRQGEPVEMGKTFRQGMVFRCNPDGSDIEILGNNFRNNYELAVDPYGALWQSDNDDDGNRGTRINFVMEFGNYGFRDQVTGAAWRTPRIGMHEDIPKRHWHLNDPGVVPNLLQTGAGSPTGILVYEGDQLPLAFRHQMLHCEPGKNVVRSYPVKSNGAGYSAEILPLVESIDDWFRPSDVCVAPDGSVMIADWYDAGVGGHLMADIDRGRIYRVHAEGEARYAPRTADLSSVKKAVLHLNHPNQESRYLAFSSVTGAGKAGIDALQDLINKTTDRRLQARAYWCLATMSDDAKTIALQAISEEDANLQMTGLRIARQFLTPVDLLAVNAKVLSSTNAQVLREAAVSLRFIGGAEADAQWVSLAKKYDGQDRWYLEALGIGADLHADSRTSAYLRALDQSDLPGSNDIIWRSRSNLVLPHLYDLIKQSKSSHEMVRYFRAMHFLSPEKTDRYLLMALSEKNHPRQKAMARYALGSISPELLQKSNGIRRRVDQILPDLRGSDMWTMVIRNANLKSELPVLLDSALVSKDQSFRSEASNLIVQVGDHSMLVQAYQKAPDMDKLNILDLASGIRSESNRTWLFSLLENMDSAVSIRRAAAKALARDWNGQGILADRLEDSKFTGTEAETIASFLTQAGRNDVRQRAIAWLAEKKGSTPIDLVSLAERSGDASQGKSVFDQYCLACHLVNGQGVDFGPDLSQIGDKLGVQGLLSSIVYPSQGIGFGYEGFNIQTKNGTRYSGFIESQTELDLTLRMMGGISQTIPLNSIVEQQPMEESLMTANLHQLMDESKLIDLITYLSTLKAEEL